MESAKIERLIGQWLQQFHTPATHIDVLEKVLVVGKASHAWVTAIQRHIEGHAMQRASKGEIKTACRALLRKLEEK